jgi:TetR/AcrR family transcriptional repressor of nem operon
MREIQARETNMHRSMDTKASILKAGAQIVHQKGFNATGLQEILAAAGVPKGSFYHYFRSKEDFGLALIDYFAAYLKDLKDRFYEDPTLSPVDKVRRLFRWQAESFLRSGFHGGCPIGNLALEMGDCNEKFRKKLHRVFADMKKTMAAHLEQASKQGEISRSIDVPEAVDFILSSWEGALMQMKVSKSTYPHEVFDRMVFERLLGTE